MKRMQEKDIPAFVQDVVATGCDICAVSPSCYSLGDTDVPRDKRRELYKKLGEIDAHYGSRDHLRYQIAAHLASIGRYIDAPPKEEEAWIDNETPELAEVTPYDVAHFQTYAVLLMSEEMGLDWRKVARAILNIDPERQPERARRAWTSHLARARWLATSGCGQLQSDRFGIAAPVSKLA
ncbi:hypothetical protein [Mesorhizobium sp.]|uniref:hypothetical protein n=1 Tax=Mesorhizobium sp. TaxID=1871066 RepID=UPI00268A89C5